MVSSLDGMKCNPGNNALILPDFAALHPGYINKKMGLTVYQSDFLYKAEVI